MALDFLLGMLRGRTDLRADIRSGVGLSFATALVTP
jgi:hypothetical protein